MANITYFFGAGASANALPVINELSVRMNFLKEEVEKHLQDEHHILIVPKKFDNFNAIIRGKELVADIAWLLDEMKTHFTIDTLAKRFYLNRKNHLSLLRLKKVLYAYFLFEQSLNSGYIRKDVIKELPDRRYDSFIATLISNEIDNLEMPNNVKVITWNYDIQFELAYSTYIDGMGVFGVQDKLNIFPDFNKARMFDLSKFSIIHLNGLIFPVPNWSVSEKFDGLPTLEYDTRYTTFLQNFCKSYREIVKHYLKNLNFAWEDSSKYEITDKERNNCIQYAKEVFSKTDILVIVGYSFPLFNRRVDYEIFSALNDQIKSIYIQDTSEKAKELCEQFIDAFSEKIHLQKGQLKDIVYDIGYTNQFYYPIELTI